VQRQLEQLLRPEPEPQLGLVLQFELIQQLLIMLGLLPIREQQLL